MTSEGLTVCSDSDEIALVINNINILQNDTTICKGESVQLPVFQSDITAWSEFFWISETPALTPTIYEEFGWPYPGECTGTYNNFCNWGTDSTILILSLIHISEPTRPY